ncbi:hypothetical protein GCM10020001_051780 [Nonomuraea salmonea]
MTTTTWLITGSSRGFGRALAEAALERGDHVLATARDPRRLDDLVQRYGDRARIFALDVTDAAAARAAVQEAVTAFGRLDVVVNNAGYANSSPIEETPDDDFRAQIETNFYGVVNVTKAALPVLRAQRSGHFIQFSSIGGAGWAARLGWGRTSRRSSPSKASPRCSTTRSSRSASRSPSSSPARSVRTGPARPCTSRRSAPTTSRPSAP